MNLKTQSLKKSKNTLVYLMATFMFCAVLGLNLYINSFLTLFFHTIVKVYIARTIHIFIIELILLSLISNLIYKSNKSLFINKNNIFKIIAVFTLAILLTYFYVFSFNNLHREIKSINIEFMSYPLFMKILLGLMVYYIIFFSYFSIFFFLPIIALSKFLLSMLLKHSKKIVNKIIYLNKHKLIKNFDEKKCKNHSRTLTETEIKIINMENKIELFYLEDYKIIDKLIKNENTNIRAEGELENGDSSIFTI